MMKAAPYTIPWPAHQANPKGRTWHVERDGQIIASGVGLERCLKGGADALAARIDSAVAKRSAGPAGPQAASGTVFVRENEERDGVEVSFPDRPAPDVLDRLRAAGFRWHRQLRYWYAKRNPETLALARSLLS
ncbi:MAG TPA: hypothetical protein GXX28_05800 [Firmicutes bacterium]|nr:hypothetical protein [Bacillota bacterium]